MSKPIIAVDFDGTIVEHQFPMIGPAVPGAFHWMKRWQELGARLILWTMRSDGRDNFNPLTDAVEFCRKNGVEFWAVNSNPEQVEWTTSPKVYAHIYVDDAAAGVPLVPNTGGMIPARPYVDWSVIGPEIEKFLAGQ